VIPLRKSRNRRPNCIKSESEPIFEADCQPHREPEHLVQEKLRIENRIEALLFTQGIRERSSLLSWDRDMADLRTGDGRPLPSPLRAELDRLRRRLVLALEPIRELEAERAAALRAATEAPAADSAMTKFVDQAGRHVITKLGVPET